MAVKYLYYLGFSVSPNNCLQLLCNLLQVAAAIDFECIAQMVVLADSSGLDAWRFSENKLKGSDAPSFAHISLVGAQNFQGRLRIRIRPIGRF